MKAFLARRLSLSSNGHGNVLMLGSRYSSATLALREFLTRDGHRSRMSISIPIVGAQEPLDRFGVCSGDVPIVICNKERVLRNPSPREGRAKRWVSMRISTNRRYATS